MGIFGDFFEGIYENCVFVFKCFDNKLVVDDFVIYINWCIKGLEC